MSFVVIPYQSYQFLPGRQGLTQAFGHLIGCLVGGHAHGLRVVANHKLHILAVGALAEHDADAGVLVRLTHLLVEYGEVAHQLAEVAGLKVARLQLDDHHRVQLAVEEQQVGEVLHAIDLQ